MIVGTAGHIDHGKTALVRALTGIDTDRLKEEKARGISIDLGFAYLPLADGRTLGFVDVPGHDRFIRNMVAGASGIDFALLVVAADDGIMPQTREHLAIIALLGIARGAVAISKCDLVDARRLECVAGDIRALLASTPLADAPILPVSGTTGAGVEALHALLAAAAAETGAAGEGGRFRLAVDRCFSLAGAGTIVTGAILSGAVAEGDRIMVSPGGLPARVRAIHAQNRPAARGVAGDRCALNLAGDGISRQAIRRGDMILDPALHAPTDRIDVRLRLLPGEVRLLAHWTPVRIHHDTAERGARIALIAESPIPPGGEGLAQIVLDAPIAAAAGDRFILRDTSGGRTMGGGVMIDLRPPARRRRAPRRLAQLRAMALDDPAASLAAQLECWPHFVDANLFFRDRALDDATQTAVLADVPHVRGGERALFAPATWDALAISARAALADFHARQPQLLGMARARLAGLLMPRLPLPVAQGVITALVSAGGLVAQGGSVRLPEHELGLDKADQALWDRIAPLLGGEARFRPPRAPDIAEGLGARLFEVRRVLKAMARRGELVEIAPDHFFLRGTETEMARIVRELAAGSETGEFIAAQLRDRLHNGRKVAIQILDHFDRSGLTLRRGDLRRINPPRLAAFLGD